MNILFLHSGSSFGGSARSLIEITKPLKIRKVILTSSCNVVDHFKKKFKVYTVKWLSIFDNTKYGYYRGFRWFILLREVIYLPISIFTLISILKKEQIDIVHLNEATLFFYAYLIKKWFKKKVVLHVRSIQCTNKNLRRKFFEFMVKRYIDKIVAIDMSVRKSLPESWKVEIIHNSLSFENENILLLDKNNQNEFLALGYIGILYKAKGIYELLQAMKILINEKKYNVKLFIAGNNTRKVKNKILKTLLEKLNFYDDTEQDIIRFIKRESLQNHVFLLGFIDDLVSFYKKIDVIVFPSFLNAIGRPVIEASYFKIPSIVAIKDPYPDTFIPNQTGINVDEPNPVKLANAIEFLYKNRDLITKMGENAYILANKNFNININSERLYMLYKELVLNNI